MLANLYPIVRLRGGADPMSWIALAVTVVVLAVIVTSTIVAALRIRREQASAAPAAPITLPSAARAA